MSPDFDGALTEEEVRREVAEARRVVIKVGSSSLSSESHGLNTDRVAALVRTLADCHDEGHDVVLEGSYALSKRTSLYAQAYFVDADDDSFISFKNDFNETLQNGYQVGIRHTF